MGCTFVAIKTPEKETVANVINKFNATVIVPKRRMCSFIRLGSSGVCLGAAGLSDGQHHARRSVQKLYAGYFAL